MSMEECKLCGQDSTPWFHINGHICQDCYYRDRWISVEDDIPFEETEVLIFWSDCITTGYNAGVDGDQYWIDSERGCNLPVTHWQPLPDPPKGQNNE